MKRILLTALLALSAGLLPAQLVDVINEVYYQDGMFDCEELELGTNPLLQDSDQDGLTDPLEVHVTQTNPLDPDTDGDGCDDASEIMFQCDDSPFNPDCPTDLNGDGAIDANDILDLIGTYGTFCDAP